MNKQTLLTLAALLLASPALAWAPKPAITLSSSALSFNGSSGQVSTQPLTITSASSTPMVIQALLFSNKIFSKQASLPVTLSKGQSVVVHVVAQPEGTAETGALTISTNQGLLTIPLSETGTTAATHQVSLQWDASASGSGAVANYEVNRAASGSTQFSTLAKTGATTTAWTDNSVQAGKTYVYEVLTVGKTGTLSSPSNKVTLAVP